MTKSVRNRKFNEQLKIDKNKFRDQTKDLCRIFELRSIVRRVLAMCSVLRWLWRWLQPNWNWFHVDWKRRELVERCLLNSSDKEVRRLVAELNRSNDVNLSVFVANFCLSMMDDFAVDYFQKMTMTSTNCSSNSRSRHCSNFSYWRKPKLWSSSNLNSWKTFDTMPITIHERIRETERSEEQQSHQIQSEFSSNDRKFCDVRRRKRLKSLVPKRSFIVLS